MHHLIKRKNRGHTLIELLMASTIMLVTLTLAYTSLSASRTNYNILESRVSARQELLKLSNYIHNDVRNAAYVFVNRNVEMDGIQFELKDIDEPSGGMILALPENLGLGTQTYTIIGYYLERTKGDSINTDTRDMVRYEKTGVVPQIIDTPASIDLENVTGGNRKIIARNIDPDRLSFTIRDNGNRVDINPVATRRQIPNQKPAEVEVFTSVNLRNK